MEHSTDDQPRDETHVIGNHHRRAGRCQLKRYGARGRQSRFCGAIGNQFGEGDGKDIMTLAGILMGASIANDAEKAAGNGAQKVISQEVCENKVRQKIEKRLSHYKVTVDYNGSEVSFSTKRRPFDDVIKIEVTVDGLEN